MPANPTLPAATVAARAVNLQRLLDHLEARHGSAEHDGSIPFAVAGERYAVVLQDNDPGNRGNAVYIGCANGPVRASTLAERAIQDGMQVLGMYDLDDLRGDAPDPMSVMFDGVEYEVEDYDAESVVVIEVGGHGLEVSLSEVVVTDAEPDERVPAFYPVAGVRVVVSFNTMPSGGAS